FKLGKPSFSKGYRRVKNIARLLPSILLCIALSASAAAQSIPPTASAQTPIQKSIEAFLRHAFALGSDVQIIVGTPAEVGNSGLMETNIEVKTPQGSDKVKMFVTKDGKYLIRGELSDLSKDPMAEIISKMKLDGAPVLGDPKAQITIVEFADFECPV